MRTGCTILVESAIAQAAMIGIFDSGIGGLTVLKELRRQFPAESFLYLGDTARLPYGTKSPATIRNYLEQNIKFLLRQKVNAIVVACNSASSVLTETQFEGVPVYNVIEPGAKRAVATSVGKRIGVIGTRATIGGQAYVRAIHRLVPEAEVFQQACPLLVPLVEEGWIDDPLTNLVLYRYLQPLLQTQIDTLILGCTHYPAIKDAIRKVTGPGVALVDSAEAISELIRADFASAGGSTGSGKIQLVVTDGSPTFLRVAELIMEHPIHHFETVDVGRD